MKKKKKSKHKMSEAEETDFYKILGIEKNASDDDEIIRSAFHMWQNCFGAP